MSCRFPDSACLLAGVSAGVVRYCIGPFILIIIRCTSTHAREELKATTSAQTDFRTVTDDTLVKVKELLEEHAMCVTKHMLTLLNAKKSGRKT